ncbi:Cloroperoxidase [Roridomyces roridus]|uniref:Cloroperoxidase n=1 Tax=Roridomyces roridus TaxID=1738132 RepID=A0AAD7B2F4_9AGAR|nr:Cloroperoxidase [Roridomyces roridus]
MLSHIILVLACAAVVSSQPSDNHEWKAPEMGQVRSPCPGLNTLANHGYISRSGKGITIAEIMEGAVAGFNVANTSILQAAKVGLLSGSAFDTMDLDALALHNLVEHDASISRQDWALGDNLNFNETLFSVMANINPESDFYSPETAAQVQKMRLDDSIARNPSVTNTDKEFQLRCRESALYLSIFGNTTTGVAPKQFVNIFFRDERLPIEEGWKRSEVLITPDTMHPMQTFIFHNSNWTQTQACEPLVLGSGIVI